MRMYIPEDKLINVGSVHTRYWIEGEGSPVILIHGLSNSIEDWLLNIGPIASQHRVYALDLIGHGRTDKPISASYKMKDLAQFVIDFMDSLQIKNAHLIGHSFGGGIALMIAINFPSYCKKMVLIDSAGLAQECSSILRLLSVPLLGEFLGSIFVQGDFEKGKSMQRNSWPDPNIVPDEMIRLKYNATLWEDIQKTYFKTLRANGNLWGLKKSVYEPILQGLPDLQTPLLVVWGQQDDLLPVSQAQIVKDYAPHAQLEIFENCKHDPMVVDPQRFNKLVLEFLKD